MSKKKIFIIAGEASGDTLGANLMKAMNDEYEVYGVGGDLMKAAGVKLLFHYEEIAVLGLFEVLTSYFRLMRHLKQTIQAIIEFQPDLIVTIDSPGFNFRVMEAIRKTLKCKAIHYVAPSVWAYAENRVQRVARLYDHILLILPFESSYFECMPHTFVGHPIVEDTSCLLHNFTKDMNFERKHRVISIMAGSRKSELKHHLPILIEYVKLMSDRHDIEFHFLTLPHLKDFLQKQLQDIKNLVKINDNPHEHNKIIQESVLGIVKSGTATMRFMANATPAITFYKVSNLTAWIMKRRLKINTFNLCNLITNSTILPELIQENFSAKNLLDTTIELLSNPTARDQIIRCYLNVWNAIQQNECPSIKAVQVIRNAFDNNKQFLLNSKK